MPECKNCGKLFKRTGQGKTEKLCEKCWDDGLKVRYKGNKKNDTRKTTAI